MRSDPIVIDWLGGRAVVDTNMFSGTTSVTVGGIPAQGAPRGNYELTTASGGTVPAKVRVTPFHPYPTIETNGGKYRTGPASSIVMTVVGLLPLALVFVGEGLGGAVGAGGAVANVAIARSSRSTVMKVLLMVVVFVVAVAAYLVVAAAVLSAISGPTGR